MAVSDDRARPADSQCRPGHQNDILMTNALDFDAATRDLVELSVALAAIEQDAEFGAAFAGTWLEAGDVPRAVVAVHRGRGPDDLIAVLRSRYPVLADPRCRVDAVPYSMAELVAIQSRFRQALTTRNDLQAMVAASGISLQCNRFHITVLSSASSADCANASDEGPDRS